MIHPRTIRWPMSKNPPVKLQTCGIDGRWRIEHPSLLQNKYDATTIAGSPIIIKHTPTGPPNSYPWLLFIGFGLTSGVWKASFSSAISFFVTDRVTRVVVTVALSLVTVVVKVEDSSTVFSGILLLLEERRLGVAISCLTFATRLSSDVFWAGGRPRLLAGDRDRERDLRPGERDLLRAGDRAGDVERERKGSCLYKKMQGYLW